MKDEFLNWHRVCVTLELDAGLTTKIESETEIEEKSNFLDLVADMLRSAEDDNIEALEDILSMKLSSEAVQKLVSASDFNYLTCKVILLSAKQVHLKCPKTVFFEPKMFTQMH